VANPLLLLDGNSLTYRAFFALPTDMATASGQVTNAVFGFTSMLVNLLKDHKPTGLLVAFDRPEPTFRHEQLPTYKAQREAAPDILRQQMGLVRQVLDALGVTVVEMAGWEADDIIATVATRAEADGRDVLIVTGDRDSYQLVHDPLIKVLYNRRGVSDYALYDEAGIKEKTGVTPEQYVEYAAMRGDPSDNLPGVPGVGEKTAAKLINTYGGLAGIFENVDAQTPKLRASLAEHKAQVLSNADVMVLRRDVPIEVDYTDLGINPNQDEVKRLFEFLEFRTLFDRLQDALGGLGVERVAVSNAATEVLHPEVKRLESAADAIVLLQPLLEASVAGAWAGEPGRSDLVGLAVVTDPDMSEVAWVPAALLDDAELARVVAAFPAVRGNDVKPLLRSLLLLGIDPSGLQLDTAIAAYLLDPAQNSYSIAGLLERYSNVRFPDSDPVASGQLDLGGGGEDEAVRACREALAVEQVAQPLLAALDKQGMRNLYDTIENPLVRVLARMEHAGIAVDVVELRRLADRLSAEVKRLTGVLHEVVGRPFNINSPIQLREILFTERGLTPVKKTKTGASTDAGSLEKLRDQWPEFIGPLLAHREVEKLRSTYGEGLLAEVGLDGRIHATFNQTVARTGRLSSDKPNLHNIPVRREEGRQFRSVFVAAPGTELMVADYNQIELRVIAHLAADPGLVQAFTSGEDIHNATASRVFAVEPTAVTLDQRSKAKMVSYGLAYGMESYGLGQRLNIPTEEAAVILEAYFTAFPNVKAYMDRTVNEARERGYTETLFGRRRPIPELSNSNFRIRQAGERQAMNSGIQGLAADIFKVALVRIDQALEEQFPGSRLVLQVHDEVLVEVPDGDRSVVGPVIIDIMRDAADLDVPLEVNVSWGKTWAAAKS
jgi:DNA polymerase I